MNEVRKDNEMKKKIKLLIVTLCGTLIVGTSLSANAKVYGYDNNYIPAFTGTISKSASTYTGKTEACNQFQNDKYRARVSILLLNKDGQCIAGNADTTSDSYNASTKAVTSKKVNSYKNRHWLVDSNGKVIADTGVQEYSSRY